MPYARVYVFSVFVVVCFTYSIVKVEETNQARLETPDFDATTESPTKPVYRPLNESCYQWGRKSNGKLLRRVEYTTHQNCLRLCLKVKGCHAAMIHRYCYITGGYHLVKNHLGRGWITAERRCFDPQHYGDKVTDMIVPPTQLKDDYYTTRPHMGLWVSLHGCQGDRCVQRGWRGRSDIYLAVGQQITSQNHQVRLKMKRDGNLVLSCKGGDKIWESGTAGTVNTRGLKIKRNGNMVLYNEAAGKAAWTSRTGHYFESWGPDSLNSGTKLVAENNNNLVLYDIHRRPIWETGTGYKCKSPPEDGCGETQCKVTSGSSNVLLRAGERITSDNKSIYLEMRSDGNLVLCCRYRHSRPIWSSGTGGEGAKSLVFQNTGGLVINNDKEEPIWSVKSKHGGGSRYFILRAENEHNVVLYTDNEQVVWSTGTETGCQGKIWSDYNFMYTESPEY